MKLLPICAFSLLLIVNASAQVTSTRLVNSAKEPQNWLTYSGDYAGRQSR